MNKTPMEKEFSVLGIGEVMLRLSPPLKSRISHSEIFEKKAGGSELNVVSGISQLGMRTGIITKLPDNEIGKYASRRIRYSGVSDDYVIFDKDARARLGIYYYECGAYPRMSAVSYDRRASSFTSFKACELDEDIYGKCDVFHTSGITLALGESLRLDVIKMMERFKERGAVISFDVNYRAALWSEEEARRTVEGILPYTDILFISEETSRRSFKMEGTLREIHESFARKYPNLRVIASTMRRASSPSKHDFTSLVYDVKERRHFEEAPYVGIDVVDRIGSGDAYVAGALYAYLRFGRIEETVKYGNAMAALKSTVLGDITECDLGDIERIIKNHSEGERSEILR